MKNKITYIEMCKQPELLEFIKSWKNYKYTKDKINPDLKLYEEKIREATCKKCKLLMELFKRTPMTNRDYWLMTELFVLLHGSDVCEAA